MPKDTQIPFSSSLSFRTSSETNMHGKSDLAIATVGLILAYFCYHLIHTFLRHKNVPGPFWAQFTDLQRASWVTTRRAHEIHQSLHMQYGDCVQFGPNMVSISDPAAIAIVYPMRPGFPKVCCTLKISSIIEKFQGTPWSVRRPNCWKIHAC